MGKPRMIILIRHAQSEGNKNRDIHQHTPDHRVALTPEGWRQAHQAGHHLRKLLLPSDTLHFFTSPYTRTRQTTDGILSTLCSSEPKTSSGADPTPVESTSTMTSDTPRPPDETATELSFHRSSILVYDDPRLREQDFGNYQPCSHAMSRMWAERASYGHFFYRIANGESAADAYDRISGFNESLWRLFGEDTCASVVVLVTHGLMARVFLMKWYHYSVEYFEDLRNVEHCEFVIMRKEDAGAKCGGRYKLENKLRTWSELKKRDRGADENADDGEEKEVLRKRWGGCPDGCDHGKVGTTNGGAAPAQRRHKHEGSEFYPPEHSEASTETGLHPLQSANKRQKTESESGTTIVAAPLGRPLKPLPTAIMPLSTTKPNIRPGRDGGGSNSGGSSGAEDVCKNQDSQQSEAAIRTTGEANIATPPKGGDETNEQPAGRRARSDTSDDARHADSEQPTEEA